MCWEQGIARAAQAIEHPPDITLVELIEQLGSKAGIETVRRMIQAMRYRRKKKIIHASERHLQCGMLRGAFCFARRRWIITGQSTAPAFRFADEEMETAKRADLPDLPEHLGYQVRWVDPYYIARKMDSIRTGDP